jgi:hypothetical protein
MRFRSGGVRVKTGLFLLFQGLVAAALLLTACPLPDDPYAGLRNNAAVYESRVFNVRRVDNDRWYTLNALKLAEGSRSIVYVSNTELDLISSSLAQYIADEYDKKIYAVISGAFGDYLGGLYDVDNNGKTILLLLDIQDGYSGSGGYVAGYFDPVHLYDTTVHDKSNRADMLFIDVRPQSPRSMGFYVTLAHELQHLINYAVHDGQPQEAWLDEGLSCAAEYLYGGQQGSRINYYVADPQKTIARGNNFFVWEGPGEEDTLANYATAYLFFQWLRIQGGGSEIYGAIARSEFRDYRAVTGAARGRISGVAAENTDDGKIWDWLLSSWMIANYRNDPAPSLYGYHQQMGRGLNWTSHTIKSPSSTVALYPGEGVVSKKQGELTFNSGGHIKYAGIRAGLNPEDARVNPSLAGAEAVLSYNTNTNVGGSIETATVYPVPDRGSGASGGRSALSPEGLPQSYPIGIHDLRSRRPEAAASPDN